MDDDRYTPYLDWINREEPVMRELLKSFANINSGTYNLAGLALMLEALKSAFAVLQGDVSIISLPAYQSVNEHGIKFQVSVGQGLHIIKRPKAKNRIFLGGHMDTVYGQSHPFQSVTPLDDTRWQGPGVADMKGGLIIMLKALEALENSPFATSIGWEIFINPDEEVGSPSSLAFLSDCARRNDIGLVFEPCFSDGALVSERKGSLKITVIAKGRSAHAGRDMASGRNAIAALARFVIEANDLTNYKSGTTVNVGKIHGGEAINIVPDLAVCYLDIRVPNTKAMDEVVASLEAAAQKIEKNNEGIEITLFKGVTSPPKPFDAKTQALFSQLATCGSTLNTPLSWRATGGVCDGNKLSAAGLPTADTLGVRGGGLHTPEEYIDLPSLVERAQLTALYLMKVGSGDLLVPPSNS